MSRLANMKLYYEMDGELLELEHDHYAPILEVRHKDGTKTSNRAWPYAEFMIYAPTEEDALEFMYRHGIIERPTWMNETE